MKFSLSWLKTHLATDADLATILKKLNAIGLEVDGVENPAEKLAAFKIARVLTADPHPQADKLQVLTVDQGDGTPLQVVCGAPNARAGLIGVFGTEGAVVPSNGMVLKKTAIRGVDSNGMMCSSRELELGDDHDGIIELPGDAPVGQVYADWAGLNDPVIDVSITPNRQDCMGVRGIARDLAAAGLGTLNALIVPPITGVGPGPDVRTDDAEGCPAFYARTVRGVTNGASPEWMARRLKAIGQKPISTLVDITNYIMIDLGRPLHVYDMASLKGGLVARKGKPGEQVLALNGKTYTVDETMTVIADDTAVHDIGGIMGGEHSGAQDGTTDVLIECAYFTPERIAMTGQKLTLTSDARGRFERGVDPAFLDDGLSIATSLVIHLCGGTASEPTRAGSPPLTPKVIDYDPDQFLALAGVDVPADEQKRILTNLGFTVTGEAASFDYQDGMPVSLPGYWAVTVPSWRRDVDGWPDLVEEVVRIVGLDHVPSTPLPRVPGVARPTATPEQLVERRVRCARPVRSDQLVLPLRKGSRVGRRWRLGAGQPDLRRPQGHAPLAAARPALGNPPQHGSRRVFGAAVRAWPPLFQAGRARDGRLRAGRRSVPARLADRQGPALHRLRCQGRSRRLARGGGRTGRQSAEFRRCVWRLSSRPVRHAAPWP